MSKNTEVSTKQPRQVINWLGNSRLIPKQPKHPSPLPWGSGANPLKISVAGVREKGKKYIKRKKIEGKKQSWVLFLTRKIRNWIGVRWVERTKLCEEKKKCNNSRNTRGGSFIDTELCDKGVRRKMTTDVLLMALEGNMFGEAGLGRGSG